MTKIARVGSVPERSWGNRTVMEMRLALCLPRDEVSVPVVRRILKGSLETLGVVRDTIADIELALTEACTNVLDHSETDTEYEVSVGIDGKTCLIEVIDRGAHPFDGSVKGLLDAPPNAEDGRGIQLMRALVDRVEFVNKPREGMVVHLEKQLDLTDGSVISRLS